MDKVIREIEKQTQIKFLQIKVTNGDQCVITGQSPTYYHKQIATTICQAHGLSVKNEIVVK